MGNKMNIKSVALTCVLAAFSTNASANLITNGDFESGSLAGWTTTTAGESNNRFYLVANGGSGPVSGAFTQSNPNGGNFFAMSDQDGAGGGALLQSFTTLGGTLTLTYDYFDNSHLAQTGTAIDGSPGNQTARVDILSAVASPFDVGSGVVQNLFIGTNPSADTNLNDSVPWITVTDTITGLAAGSYQLRFGSGQCCYFQEFGVDNVDLEAALPESSTWAMIILGFAGIGFMTYRRKSKPALMAV
jgi:hypothetical protein